MSPSRGLGEGPEQHQEHDENRRRRDEFEPRVAVHVVFACCVLRVACPACLFACGAREILFLVAADQETRDMLKAARNVFKNFVRTPQVSVVSKDVVATTGYIEPLSEERQQEDTDNKPANDRINAAAIMAEQHREKWKRNLFETWHNAAAADAAERRARNRVLAAEEAVETTQEVLRQKVHQKQVLEQKYESSQETLHTNTHQKSELDTEFKIASATYTQLEKETMELHTPFIRKFQQLTLLLNKPGKPELVVQTIKHFQETLTTLASKHETLHGKYAFKQTLQTQLDAMETSLHELRPQLDFINDQIIHIKQEQRTAEEQNAVAIDAYKQAIIVLRAIKEERVHRENQERIAADQERIAAETAAKAAAEAERLKAEQRLEAEAAAKAAAEAAAKAAEEELFTVLVRTAPRVEFVERAVQLYRAGDEEADTDPGPKPLHRQPALRR